MRSRSGTRSATPAASSWTSHTTLATMLRQQGWETAAFAGASVLKRRFGFDQGFGVYDDNDAQAIAVRPASTPNGAYTERRVRRTARRDLAPAQPFFLWVHVFDPHSPYDPPSRFRVGPWRRSCGARRIQSRRVRVRLDMKVAFC